MATPREDMYKKSAEQLVAALRRRRFGAQFCATAQEAKEAVLALIPEGASVGWGGSETVNALGVKQTLREKGQPLFDRDSAPTREAQVEAMYASQLADVFLMSSNAITEDGCLVNVDGLGNRVSALIFGPKKVIVVAGMNKVTADLESAISRVRHYAAPMNAQRFPGESPCRRTGRCADCVSPDCICTNLVVTRLSRVEERIHVILVGEDLGM
ncbi:MAG: lactate utilization protein [Oscillospiraceae bacterium]|nr:lactate utilization protein [Oscillospiraceae bacterium]MBR3849498.1 lactate utilization protein [Oscillospiraceae bacterium]